MDLKETIKSKDEVEMIIQDPSFQIHSIGDSSHEARKFSIHLTLKFIARV
jgi:hypothetical protein